MNKWKRFKQDGRYAAKAVYTVLGLKASPLTIESFGIPKSSHL